VCVCLCVCTGQRSGDRPAGLGDVQASILKRQFTEFMCQRDTDAHIYIYMMALILQNSCVSVIQMLMYIYIYIYIYLYIYIYYKGANFTEFACQRDTDAHIYIFTCDRDTDALPRHQTAVYRIHVSA
jgi:hypothetical protein